MIKIVLISGSLRHHSLNTMAIATIGRILAGSSEPVENRVLSIDDLPYYDQDIDEEGCASDAVVLARDLVGSADAVIISTPSYNGLVPGVLKNALDWLSRPWGASALTGRTAAICSVSPGPRGAVDAQPGLRIVLQKAGAVLVDSAKLALGNAVDIPTRQGSFSEPETVARLERFTRAVLDQVHRTASDELDAVDVQAARALTEMPSDAGSRNHNSGDGPRPLIHAADG
ncbi:NAD(P)H-dependent oxidoreductase [Streptomyces sp. NPDC026665]|uniref:NADPH-dependent FMN reductase n=1 Tax=Streptomyces sp. NPDC026665 TaxID=3154798 RepID=UPI0033F02135